MKKGNLPNCKKLRRTDRMILKEKSKHAHEFIDLNLK